MIFLVGPNESEQPLVLVVSPSQRISSEEFRRIMELYRAIGGPVPELVSESALRAEWENGSRIISLPGSSNTTRGFSRASCIILDEAARIDDGLIAAIRPSLATTDGQFLNAEHACRLSRFLLGNVDTR